MLPLAMLMIVYAMLTFYYRSRYMQRKQVSISEFLDLPDLSRSPGQCELDCGKIYKSKHALPVQMGFYQDMYGPIVIACLITLVLVAILVLAAIDLARAGL